MEHRAFRLLVFLAVLSLGLNFVPNVLSQPEKVKIISYNWYVDSIGYLVVVGEVQNVGSETIDSVILSGAVYTTDGTLQSESYAQAVVKYLVPQQKAPFYMEFASDDLSWLSLGLDRIDFVINQANATTDYQYPCLTVKDSSSFISAEGEYWAIGTVQNIGNQTGRNIRVVGTFYNASGSIVAMGWSGILSPASLGPSGTASFKVGAFDMNQTIVPSSYKISSYSLLVQAEEPILAGTAPSLPPSSDPTDSSSTSDPSDSNNLVSFSPQFLIVVVFVAVILGVVGTTLLLRKHKSAYAKRSKSKSSRKKK
jgi:hypothetical protein